MKPPLGTKLAVIDPAPAVARQVGRVLARRGLEADRDRTGHHVLYSSGDAGKFARMLERLIPFVGAGVDVRPARWQEGRLVPAPYDFTKLYPPPAPP